MKGNEMNKLQKLETAYNEMQEKAKSICDQLSDMHDKGLKDTHEYLTLFMKLNRLSDERELVQIQIEGLSK